MVAVARILLEDIMSRNEWPTPSEMIVMRILQGAPTGAYGLEIVSDSAGAVKRGSVYVLLGRLEEKGFVRVLPGKKSRDLQAPTRPQYQLTAEGSRVLSVASAIGMRLAGARA
jgi:DNA-binding PadR family transcriptional regulator